MMKLSRLSAVFAAVAAFLSSAVALAQSATYSDYLVQAPDVAAPERGSVAGQYGKFALGPGDVVRGAFSITAPIDVPEERGALLANPFPAYSPEAGISEWGLGFSANLSLTRSRVLGSIDYGTDDLTGPWGRMVLGTDGSYYPAGLSAAVRVEVSGDQLVGYAPDGNVWTFGAGTDRTTTTRGTFSWWLSEVRTPTGQRTAFSYAANSSGRLFLQSVSYGGLGGGPFEARVDLGYEQLPFAFVSHRSGQAERLDRRVTSVVALVRHRETGVFVERWRHTLSYVSDTFGPAFYLSKVVKRFASGEEPPATSYSYDLPSAQLGSEVARAVPKISALVPLLRSDGIQPNHSSTLDVDGDGRPDLEYATDGRLLLQKDDAFEVQSLAPPSSSRDLRCRRDLSDSNPPRLLAPMRAGDASTYVVSLKLEGASFDTTVRICDREGELLYTQTVPKDFTLGPLAKLVDVTGDRQPDLVRYNTGYYEVIPNTSTAQGFGFGVPQRVAISPAFTASAVWVEDITGDGLPDLVARSASSFAVWAGHGDGKFETAAALFRFYSAGIEIAGIDKYQATFVDANRDGLMDVLLVKDNRYYFFANTGTRFEQKRIEALARLSPVAGRPVVADLVGSGNIELAYVEAQAGYSIALDRPSTSLLVDTDDGRGNLVHFEYVRAAAVPGVKHRAVVLSAVRRESSGHEPLRTQYQYDAPVTHPMAGFLLGFDRVSVSTGTRSQVAHFANAPDLPGVLVESRGSDSLEAGLVSFERRDYDDATVAGVRYKRPRSTTKGVESLENAGERVESREEIVSYFDDICPSESRRTTSAGTLRRQMFNEKPAIFSRHLMCTVAAIITAGTHPDAALDFEHHVGIRRNAVGLVEHVESVGRSGGALVRSDVAYLPDYRVASVTKPAEGTAVVEWLAGSSLLAGVTAPTGVRTRVLDRDPVTDAIRSMSVDSGGPSPFVRYFRFDGQERLARQWNNVGGSSDTRPNESLTYRFATSTTPSAIEALTLVDATGMLRRRQVTLATGAGEAAGTAAQVPEGWAVEGLADVDLTTLRKRAFVRDPFVSTGSAIDYATVFAGASQIGDSQASAFGEQTRSTTFHAGITGQVVTSRAVRAGRLVVTSVENGALTTTEELDDAGNVVRHVDPAHAATLFTYDAIGRLRKVVLPNAVVHRQDFDEFERVSHVERSDVGAIDSTYDPVTGVLVNRTLTGVRGLLTRSEQFAYDSFGRVVSRRHTAAGLDSVTYRFFYDGATDLDPSTGTALGRMTAVSGPGFAKRMAFRPDGALASRELEVDGFRKVRTVLGYFEDGAEKSRTTQVLDPQTGGLFEESRSDASVDGYGRVASSTWNGRPFVAYAYDPKGLLSAATFVSDERITFGYDALTRSRVSLNEETPIFTAATWARRNARGLQGSEGIAVNGVNVTREYDYNDQGFLVRAHDGESGWGYSFDIAGLPTSVSLNGVTETFVRSSGAMTSATHDVTFDDFGRATSFDGAQFEYDAAGQISAATRGGRRLTFDYDEAGNRLAKREGIAVTAAYVPEGYLDAGGLTQPVSVGGQTVGVLRQGKLLLAPVDLRGTLTGDPDGTRKLASPFGARTGARPDLAAAIDYVQRGFDADLGTVRMGVRDYAPDLNQFLSPDPLFFADIGRVAKNPVSGNLYSYGRNAPLDFVDPLGLEESRWGQLVQVLSSPVAKSAAATALNFAASYQRVIAEESISAVANMAVVSSPPLVAVDTALKLAGACSMTGATRAAVNSALPAAPEGPGAKAGAAAGTAVFTAASVALAVAGAVELADVAIAAAVEGAAAGGSAAGPLAGVTEAEIDGALGAPGRSGPMIQAPSPTGARANVSGGMMVNEHTVQSTSSAPGATGDVATRIRVHTADPSAPFGSNSASGNTVTITQGGGARRLVPGEGWVQTSIASDAQMNASHIPIHR